MIQLNRYSARITQDKSQGASQAMLYGAGLTPEDMAKPQVGIASVWYEGNTCNMHLLELAAAAKEGVDGTGCLGLRFNTVGVSDGISMGTDGMSYSLQSRDLIADSIETVMAAQWYDANISIPGCDKNMPGCMMAIARLDRPSLVIYGGTIRSGEFRGGKIDIISAFQSYGEAISGALSEEDRETIVRRACPGAGACGGMYTANTMAAAIEALGMSLPYSSSTPAVADEKLEECRRAGAAVKNLLERDIRPSAIMTRAAFENAMVLITALGGSTNAVLHLLAIAHSAWHRPIDRRLPEGQRPDSLPGRPEALGPLLDGGPARRRRHAGRAADAARPGADRRRLPDRHRPHAGREPGLAAGSRRGPGCRAALRRTGQVHRPPPDPAGQPGAGRLGGEDHRQGG